MEGASQVVKQFNDAVSAIYKLAEERPEVLSHVLASQRAEIERFKTEHGCVLSATLDEVGANSDTKDLLTRLGYINDNSDKSALGKR